MRTRLPPIVKPVMVEVDISWQHSREHRTQFVPQEIARQLYNEGWLAFDVTNGMYCLPIDKGRHGRARLKMRAMLEVFNAPYHRKPLVLSRVPFKRKPV